MKILNEIGRKKNIPILITGQVYSEFLKEEDWLAGKEAGVKIAKSIRDNYHLPISKDEVMQAIPSDKVGFKK